MVFVEQSSEALSPVDLTDLGGESQHRSVVVRCAQCHAVALVGSADVVMIEILSQHPVQVGLAGDEDPVATFAADGADKPLRVGVILGACGAVSRTSTP